MYPTTASFLVSDLCTSLLNCYDDSNKAISIWIQWTLPHSAISVIWGIRFICTTLSLIKSNNVSQVLYFNEPRLNIAFAKSGHASWITFMFHELQWLGRVIGYQAHDNSASNNRQATCPHPSWSLQWRHNERDGVSNYQPHDSLLNRLFRRRSKKTSKLRATGFCAGNSLVTGEFPAQRTSNAENDSIWWRHGLPELISTPSCSTVLSSSPLKVLEGFCCGIHSNRMHVIRNDLICFIEEGLFCLYNGRKTDRIWNYIFQRGQSSMVAIGPDRLCLVKIYIYEKNNFLT